MLAASISEVSPRVAEQEQREKLMQEWKSTKSLYMYVAKRVKNRSKWQRAIDQLKLPAQQK